MTLLSVHLQMGDGRRVARHLQVLGSGRLHADLGRDEWGGCRAQVMVLSQDRDKGRVALSTRKLERTKGDMLRDPQKARALLWAQPSDCMLQPATRHPALYTMLGECVSVP